MKYDIIIVGGNLVGAVCAVALAKLRADFKIAIIETNLATHIDDSKLDSRVYAISPHNHQQLRELNLWPNAAVTGQILQMNVSGPKSNIVLDSLTANRNYLAKIIESNKLLKAIYMQIAQYDNIDIINTRLINIEIMPNTTQLIAENGKTYTASFTGARDGSSIGPLTWSFTAQ